MSIASTSRTTVAYVPEATFGVTPADPAWQKFRRTGGNLTTKKTTAVSSEVRADRNVVDELQVAQDVSGSYDYEFSAGTLDDMFAAALQGEWTNDTIINGTHVRSFSVEEATDLDGGAIAYNRFAGVTVEELSLNIDHRAVIKGSVSLMGIVETTDTAIVAGATYLDPNTKIIETATSVANVSVAGLADAPIVKSLRLAFKSNLRVRGFVGSLYSKPFGIGEADVTGELDCYFNSISLYQSMLNHEVAAISFAIGAVPGSKYNVIIPRARLLSGTRKYGGVNDDVMLTLPFRGILDAATGGSIKIQRNQ